MDAYKSPYQFISKKYKKKYKINLIIHSDKQKECLIKGRIRLNGDNRDHINIRENTLVSSLDVRLKDNINTFTDFKLLLPHTRKGDNEIFISTILNNLNLLTPKIYFTEMEMFQQKNKYLFYENLNKEFLERNKKVEGPIIRGDERFFFNDGKKNFIFARLENSNWIKENKKNQIERSVEALTLANKLFISTIKTENMALDPHLKFDYDNIKEYINYENIIKFRLLINAFGASNSLSINDLRMYYDPVFKKFDLIFNDGSTTFLQIPQKINYSYINIEEVDKVEEVISSIDNLDLKKVRQDLSRKGLNISSDKLLYNISKLKKRLKIIESNKSKLKKNENTNFSKKNIANMFINTNLIYSYYVKDNQFELCTNLKCKYEILDLKDVQKMLNQRLKRNKKDVIFLGYKDSDKKIKNFSDKSKWSFKKINNTKIYYSKESKIQILDKKINIFAKNNSRVMFTGGVMENVKIDYKNEGSLSKDNFSNLNGCINFYDIELRKIKINISNTSCEDSINLVRARGEIDEIISNNSISDGIDFDFSNLKIKEILVKKSKNDCLDFSFGNYIIENVEAYNCGDKAFSIGENSNVKINRAFSMGSNINIAIKDKSNVLINNMESKKTNYCVAMYRKKSEFTGSKFNVLRENCENKYNLIDPGNLFNNNVF